MVHQRNRSIHSGHGLIGFFDLGSLIRIQITSKPPSPCYDRVYFREVSHSLRPAYCVTTLYQCFIQSWNYPRFRNRLSCLKLRGFQGLSIGTKRMFIRGTLARESGFICWYNCGLGSDSLLSIATIFKDVLCLYQAKERFNLLRQTFVRR